MRLLNKFIIYIKVWWWTMVKGKSCEDCVNLLGKSELTPEEINYVKFRCEEDIACGEIFNSLSVIRNRR